jgi:hypothetical protein
MTICNQFDAEPDKLEYIHFGIYHTTTWTQGIAITGVINP